MAALPPWLALGPRALERPASAGWTTVGVLDATATARVDGAGLVSPEGNRWSLDWWIGAADRWHLPAVEPAVRQRRLGPGPVIETSLRIPSGDAVHRVWAVRHGGGEVLVVEVENASPTPVALALAVRPYGPDAPIGAVASVDVAERCLLVDGAPALWLPRPPNEATATAGGDVLEQVRAGRALVWPGPVADAAGRVTAAVVYPLPHRTRLRVVLPLTSPARAVPVSPDGVADHETVGRGWSAVVGAGARLVLPDPGLGEQAAAWVARVLLGAATLPAALADLEPGAGVRTAALAAAGHPQEALRAMAVLADRRPPPTDDVGAVVEAVGGVALAGGLQGDRSVEEALTEPLVDLISLVDRRRTRVAAAPALAALAAHLRRVGQDAAADAVTRRRVAAARRAGANTGGHRAGADATAGDQQDDAWAWAGPRPTPDGLVAEVGALSATGAFPGDDAVRAAAAWLAVRRLLVVEDDRTLAVLPHFPSAWRGGVAEAHALPTLHGSLSFAIRWHGYRPALLWQLEARPGRPAATIRCPGLDPDWSADEPRGEVLLAGVADGLAPPPSEGDSFS